MRRPRGTIQYGWLLFWLLFVLPGAVVAQTIQFDAAHLPLAEALVQVGKKAGVDVVFAERFVAGQSTTCTYAGDRVDEALACVLAGTNLTIERMHPRQYVLVRKAVALQPLRQASALNPSFVSELSGRVVDDATGDPLPGTHILLPDADFGTTTDGEGRFALPGLTHGVYRVHLSFVGFETTEALLTTGETSTIELTPVALETGEIVVESERDPEVAASPVSGAVPVLARQAARSPSFLAEDDLFQTLQWLPSVRQTGEVGGALVIRGSGPEQNLHLLDGAPLYHPWQTMGLFSTLQTDVLSDARLYSGSIPAEFGGRLSAVLDTYLKDGNQADPHLQVSLGTMSSNIVAETPLAPWASLMVAARRSYSNGLLAGGGLEVPDRETLQNSAYTDLNAKIMVRPWDRHELRFTVYRGRDRLSDTTPAAIEALGWNRYLKTSTPLAAARYQWTNQLFNLQHSYLYSRRLLLTTTAYSTSYKAQDQPDQLAPKENEYTMRVRDVGFKLDVDHFRSLRHTLRMGTHLTYHYFRNLPGDEFLDAQRAFTQSREGFRLNALEAAAYVQDTWQVTSRWQVQPGVRFSYFSSNTNMHMMPRFNTRFMVHPEYFVLKAGLSRQVQYIHQVQDQYAAAYELSASRWVSVAADHVNSATGVQASVGLESRPWPGLHLFADLYWRDFKHVLLAKSPNATAVDMEDRFDQTTVLQGYESSEQKAYGVELLGQYRTGPWKAWTSYAAGRSLARAMDASDGVAYHSTRFDVPHTLRGGLNWTGVHWAFSVVGEVRSGYPVAPVYFHDATTDPEAAGKIASVTVLTVTEHLQQLPTYARLDARIGYRFEGRGFGWNAQLQLFNLTNRKNVIGHVYAIDAPSVKRANMYGLTRMPLIKVQVEL